MQFSATLRSARRRTRFSLRFFAASDLFSLTHMYTNKVGSMILVFVVRTWQTVFFLTILFRRNTAALTDSNSIVLIRLRKHVSIQTLVCTIRVSAVRSTRTNSACADVSITKHEVNKM